MLLVRSNRSSCVSFLAFVAGALFVSVGCHSGSESDPSKATEVGGFPIPDSPPDAQSLTIANYCEAKAKVQCHLDVPCCVLAGGAETEASCHDVVLATCRREVTDQQAKGHVFDPANAGLCVLGGAALYDGCTARKSPDDAVPAWSTLINDACGSVWKGTVAPGGSCTEQGDCAAGDIPGARAGCSTYITGADVRHTCELSGIGGAGATCKGNLDCRRDLECFIGSATATCASKHPRALGETCSAPGDTCAKDALCKSGVCSARSALGEACLPDYPTCAAPNFCNYAEKKCTPRLAIGAACKYRYDLCEGGICEGDFDAATCIPIVASGAACSDGTAVCGDGLACTSGKCAPRNDVGSKRTCATIDPPPSDAPLTAAPSPAPHLVSVAYRTACAVTAAGGVTCWGVLPASGGPISKPTSIAGIRDAVEIATGEGFACVRHATGTISCWGYGKEGELGQMPADTCDTSPCAKSPIDVPGVSGAVKLVAGSGRACVLEGDGSIVCWGLRAHGDGDFVAPTRLAGVANAIDLTATLGSICAVTSGGNVKCWKSIDAQPDWDLTIDGAYEAKVTSIAMGGQGLVVAHADGTVTRGPEGLTDVTQVAGGEDFSCAVQADGTVRCWGSNGYGQLGTGSADATALSVVRGVAGASEVAASSIGQTACARVGDSVWCWGNDFDQLVSSGFSDMGPRKVF